MSDYTVKRPEHTARIYGPVPGASLDGRQPHNRRGPVMRFPPFLRFPLTCLLAASASLLLFHTAFVGNLTTAIISMGLDLARAQMIAALLITAGTALMGAGFLRSKMGAIAGSGGAYSAVYLVGFVYTQLQPVRDPGNLLEPLDTHALISTVIMLLALGLLSGLTGAAIGINLGETLLDPPFQLIHALWKDLRRRHTPVDRMPTAPYPPIYNLATPAPQPSTQKLGLRLPIRLLGTASMVAILILVDNSANLFIFSPDVGLHTVPGVHSHEGVPDHGTVIQASMQSAALKGQSREFRVYLPPSYNTSLGANKSYPVLYLLHGSPGKSVDWITGGKAVESADTLIAAGKIAEMMIVFPDGNGYPGATSEWGNSFDKRQLLETYLASDLVHYVDTHYRTTPDAAYRAIGGLSMGGFGATNIAIHHPDIFGSCITLGGYYRAEGAIWGANPLYMRQNSPINTLPANPQSWKLHIYLGAATEDQPYYNDTKEFMLVLDKLHMNYRFDLKTGYHSWHVWQAQLYNALLWLNWT